MPIYEYKRLTDGSIFEIEQRITEDALTHCPTTGAPVEKIISKTNFHLKGGGWYVTDYKKEKPATPVPEAKAEASPETKSETKSDSPNTDKAAGKKEASSPTESKPKAEKATPKPKSKA